MYQLISAMSATIEKNTISMNTKDMIQCFVCLIVESSLGTTEPTTKYNEYLKLFDILGLILLYKLNQKLNHHLTMYKYNQ